MPKPDYSSPETIFTVPNNISELEKQDAIGLSLDRIKGSLMTAVQLLDSGSEFSTGAVRDSLMGAYSQLEMVDKLINHNKESIDNGKLKMDS